MTGRTHQSVHKCGVVTNPDIPVKYPMTRSCELPAKHRGKHRFTFFLERDEAQQRIGINTIRYSDVDRKIYEWR